MAATQNFDFDQKPHDHCGLAGAVAKDGVNASNVVIEMGKALQHRGQNGGGVAVKGEGKLLKVYKKAEPFNEVFRSIDVVEENSLRGEIAIAHLRYPTEGAGRQNCDAQPFYASHKGWELALGHNGSIVDVKKTPRQTQEISNPDGFRFRFRNFSLADSYRPRSHLETENHKRSCRC